MRHSEEVVRCCIQISGCLDFDYFTVASDGIEDTGGSVACGFIIIEKLY